MFQTESSPAPNHPSPPVMATPAASAHLRGTRRSCTHAVEPILPTPQPRSTLRVQRPSFGSHQSHPLPGDSIVCKRFRLCNCRSWIQVKSTDKKCGRGWRKSSGEPPRQGPGSGRFDDREVARAGGRIDDQGPRGVGGGLKKDHKEFIRDRAPAR